MINCDITSLQWSNFSSRNISINVLGCYDPPTTENTFLSSCWILKMQRCQLDCVADLFQGRQPEPVQQEMFRMPNTLIKIVNKLSQKIFT